MIDLHTHILPGLDDGADTMEASLAMARRAVDDGIQTLAATPHLNFRYDVRLEAVTNGVDRLNSLLTAESIPLTVVAGAEVDAARALELSLDEMRRAALGDGAYVLVESPYGVAAGILDETLYEVQLRGLVPVLAHPERSPLFQHDIDHLHRLAARGVLCSVNSGSMSGAFGSTVRRFAVRLFEQGLVHAISSDAHDPDRRPPILSEGLEAMRRDLPGLSPQWQWYTHEAPAAMLTEGPLPKRPASPSRSWWRRIVR